MSEVSQRGQSHNLSGGGNGRDTIGILGVGQLESIPIYFSAHVWHMTSAWPWASTPTGGHFPMTSVRISPAHYVYFGAAVSCLTGRDHLISVDVRDVADANTGLAPLPYLAGETFLVLTRDS